MGFAQLADQKANEDLVLLCGHIISRSRYHIRMERKVTMNDSRIDKAKFDTILQQLIASPATSMEAAKAMPKIRKDGQLKRTKSPRTS
jgi:hypothetical protein